MRRLPHVRPADDRDARLGQLRLSLPRSSAGQPLDHFVEQIADAQPVLGGDLHDRLESELVEIERAGARAPVVGLVDRHDHRPALRSDRLGDLEIGRHEPFAAIDHEDEHRGVLERPPAVLEDELLKGSSLLPNMPAVSVSRNGTVRQFAGCWITSRVVPAVGVDDGAPRRRQHG